MTPLIYLAAPYASPSDSVRDLRFSAMTHISHALLSRGHMVFSPLTHGHPINSVGRINPELWYKLDLALLKAFHGIVVCRMEGWMHSRGIQLETEFAAAFRRPLYQTAVFSPKYWEGVIGEIDWWLKHADAATWGTFT